MTAVPGAGKGGHGDGWDLMTAPLLRNVISGVVWYQGESNEQNPLSYNCTFPAMIAAWRQYVHKQSAVACDTCRF